MKKSASYTLKGIQELFNQTHFGGFFIARRKQMAGNLDFRLNLLANTTGLQQGMDGAKFAVNALVGVMAALGVGLGVNELAKAADKPESIETAANPTNAPCHYPILV